MKKWISIPLLIGAFILLSMDWCPDGFIYPVENLSYTVNTDGGGVKLTWRPSAGYVPDGYYVYQDGGSPIDVADTFYVVTTPAATIDVTAYTHGEESDPEILDFAAVETPSIELWSTNDPSPDHPSGFGFALAGTATAYSVVQQPDSIDYWLWQEGNGTLVSPSGHQPPYNAETNSISSEQGIYDELGIVSPRDSFYTQKTLVQNAVYGLWFEGDDGKEYFAKMFVSSLSNNSGVIKADLKLAYQTAPGLRWVKTP